MSMLENEVGARYQPHHEATFVDFGSDRRSDAYVIQRDFQKRMFRARPEVAYKTPGGVCIEEPRSDAPPIFRTQACPQ